jgi:hypothetical protein
MCIYIYIILCMYNCIAIKHDKTTQQSRIMGSTSRIAKWTQSKQVEGPVFGLPVSSQKICWTTIASPGLLRQFWSLTVTSSLFSSHSYPIKKTRLNHINWSLNHPQFRIFFALVTSVGPSSPWPLRAYHSSSSSLPGAKTTKGPPPAAAKWMISPVHLALENHWKLWH